MEFIKRGYVRFDDGTVGCRTYCTELGSRGECWRPLHANEVEEAKEWHAGAYPLEEFRPIVDE